MRRSKIPQGTFTTTIQSLSHEGRGIGEWEGKKCFIHGALPGEIVDFEITFLNKKRAEGRAVHIHQASPSRVVPKCEAFGRCGGCSLQHMDHDAQLSFKQKMVLELFAHIGKVTPETVLPPLKGPIWGYRKKARLGVRDVPKKGGVLVGFRETFSNRIAVMNQCEVLDDRVGKLIEPLKNLLSTLESKADIPQIEVAATEKEAALVIRHLVPLPEKDKAAFSQFCKEHHLAFYSQAKGQDSVVRLYPEGPLHLSYDLNDFGLRFSFHPLDFTQVNSDINQQMVQEALDWLDVKPEDTVLDLFCGIGNFTLPLAKRAKAVVGVEGAQTAVERAQENAALNEIENADFFVANLFEPPFEAPWAQKSFDKILLDPPRSGAEQVMPLIGQMKPRKIVYVSCGPATLARDAHVLVHEFGYQLKKLKIMDMFPHTAHVETLCLFER